nr:hypothetical protein Iba_scaffold9108CG0270 [Ipomoea batatas]GME11643.1 hypothetical protein Iba_scaffold12083CG0040 [Ipomoea batatas]
MRGTDDDVNDQNLHALTRDTAHETGKYADRVSSLLSSWGTTAAHDCRSGYVELRTGFTCHFFLLPTTGRFKRIATLLIFSGWFVRTPFQGYFSEQKRPLSIATPEVTCSFADNGACTLAKRTAQGHRQMNTSIPIDRLFVEVERRETGLEQLTAIRPETAGEDVMGARSEEVACTSSISH